MKVLWSNNLCDLPTLINVCKRLEGFFVNLSVLIKHLFLHCAFCHLHIQGLISSSFLSCPKNHLLLSQRGGCHRSEDKTGVITAPHETGSKGRRVWAENLLTHYVWLFLEAQREAEHPLYLHSSLQLSISNHFWMLTPWKRQVGRKVKWSGQGYTGSCWQGWEINSQLHLRPPATPKMCFLLHSTSTGSWGDTTPVPPQCVGAGARGSLQPREELCALATTSHKHWLSPCQEMLLLLHKHHTGLSWSFLLTPVTSFLSASGSQLWQRLSDTPCQPPPPLNSFFPQVSLNVPSVSSPYVWNKLPEEKTVPPEIHHL